MADRRASSASQSGRGPLRNMTRRAYALQPARSPAARIATWAAVCIVSAALGAAVMHWHAKNTARRDAACAVPVAHDDTADALARAELALRQEAASRATVQKSADRLAVEVSRLQAQVLFLQGQGGSRR